MAGADPAVLSTDVRAFAAAEGFEAVGITAAAVPAAHGRALRRFVDQGWHGTMDWLATRVAERADPRTLWPEARSVIVLGRAASPAGPVDHGDPERGLVAVYARGGRDYHHVVKKRLKAVARALVARHGGQVKVFVDTAPVLEKALAQGAGLGWMGRHTNLVSRRHGAWLMLGEIYTSLHLAADSPHPDLCGRCRRCLEACPTNAFPAPGVLDARRCLSYLTIEHAGPLPPALRPALGNRVFGCDACLAVCPWNKFAAPPREPAFLPRVELMAPRLVDLIDLDDAGVRQVFAGSPLKRSGRGRLVRNALIALGNSGRPALAPAAAARLQDADPVVAEAARWATTRLRATDRDKL